MRYFDWSICKIKLFLHWLRSGQFVKKYLLNSFCSYHMFAKDQIMRTPCVVRPHSKINQNYLENPTIYKRRPWESDIVILCRSESRLWKRKWAELSDGVCLNHFLGPKTRFSRTRYFHGTKIHSLICTVKLLDVK